MKAPINTPSSVDGGNRQLVSIDLSDEDYEILEAFVEDMSKKSDEPKPTPVKPKPTPADDPKDKPLKTPYQGGDHELTYLDLPEHRRATDTTDAVMGFGRSTTTEKRDVLSKMTVGDQILLLAENNIHLSAKKTKKHKDPIGSMPSYRMLAHEFRASDEFGCAVSWAENTKREHRKD